MLETQVQDKIKLLERHIQVLKIVAENQPIGIWKIAELLQQPQHKIRYSLRVFERKKLIEPSIKGAILTREAKEEIKKLKENVKEMSESISNILKMLDEL